MRKGRDIPETDSPVNLSIVTKCPAKWVLIDTETGESYVGNSNGYWDRLEPYVKEELK